MRSFFTVLMFSVLFNATAVAQEAGESQSIDPMWLYAQEAMSGIAPSFTEPVMGSEIPVEIMFVELVDGVYAPVGLRKPQGNGPFPTVVFAHMNGGYGLRWIREWTQYGSGTLEEFLDAGYAVVWMRYRAEVNNAYGTPRVERERTGRLLLNRGPFEYEDAISIIEHVKTLPYIDPDRVGYVGLSHGGEMLMKITSEYHGLRAGIASEPASSEFLARGPRDPNAPPQAPQPETLEVTSEEIQAEAAEELRNRLNMNVAMERINAIRTPIFIQARERDHNYGTFRVNYELLRDAGKDVEWRAYDHDDHGFLFITRNADGVYDPVAVQREAVRDALAYMDRYLKGAEAD